MEHANRFLWPLYTLPNVGPRKSPHILKLTCFYYTYRNGARHTVLSELQKRSSSFHEDALESHRRSPSCFRAGLLTASTSMLVEGKQQSWQANYNLLLSRKASLLLPVSNHTCYPSRFYFCMPTLHVMAPYIQLIKTTTGSLLLWISYIYLKEGMSDSSSCLFCDISYYNAQWTIVTISSSINTFAISEVKLGLKHELQYLKHLTPIERMTHQDRPVYKTEVTIVKMC